MALKNFIHQSDSISFLKSAAFHARIGYFTGSFNDGMIPGLSSKSVNPRVYKSWSACC